MYQKSITTNFDGLITSATIAHLTGEKLKRLMVQVPPLPFQTRFADFVRQADKSKCELQRTLGELEVTYKALLRETSG
ncbi:MAG: restriction endonuclease subunit S [Desulfovibrio sp.]|nr:restriction endonuclease subunit S [Desulfovibrio sp.]